MDKVRAGKRSRGPSPNANGHLSDDSCTTDESEPEGCMRVGSSYQAIIPEYNAGAKYDSKAEAMLVWAPHPDLSDAIVDEYLSVAKEKHHYNAEQALGMLFWHKHNMEKALADLTNFTPFPDEWTVEDRVLFEQGFSFHGKSFHRIRQMLPDKSVAHLVKYYYLWKKMRSRTSLIDRQARKVTNPKEDSDDDMDASGNSDSDIENPKTNSQRSDHKSGGSGTTPIRSGPCVGKKGVEGRVKGKRKPPRGMYMNHEELLAMATGPPGQGDALLRQLDSELVSLRQQVQNNKQTLSTLKEHLPSNIGAFRSPESAQKIIARWTNEELLLAVQGVRRYGKDFKAISETIGTKTEAHIRSFFVNYRRRYNLDEALSEYDAENGTKEGRSSKDDIEEKMDVDVSKDDRVSSSQSSDQSSMKNGTAVSADGAGSVIPPPPALVKQPAASTSAAARPTSPQRHPPALHHPQIVSSSGKPSIMSGGRTILQQPPPLIRPNGTPLKTLSPANPSAATAPTGSVPNLGGESQ